MNIFRRILTNKGLATDYQKINNIINWPILESKVQIQQFIGIVNYCSQFLLYLCRITKPILRLTEKTKEFNWNLGY